MSELLDWGSLGFGYVKTDYNVRCYYRNGKWGELELSSDETINMHMAATCLHYGQEAFEGLKAYRGKDGKVRMFRVADNARRMISSGDYLCMQSPSVELFTEACIKAVKANERFIPPYGTGASLYLRPLLIGMGAQVGVKPATEYMFLVFVTPVGPYFKEGFKPIRAMIEPYYDRAAPHGMGHVKSGGNYAASLKSGGEAHAKGFPLVIYLDAKEKKYIDEGGAANFFGIKDKTYITPESTSILPSITNLSLMQLAQDLGLKLERRPVEYTELATFEEAGACGTAAVISPIGQVVDEAHNKTYTLGDPSKAGPWSTKLYETLRGIQYGDLEDKHHWVTIL